MKLNSWDGKELDNWIGRLSTLGNFISAMGVVAMLSLITAEVVMRGVFRISTLIADEVSAYLLVVITYMALGYNLRTDKHIRIRVVFDRLPPKGQRFLDLLTSVLNLAVSIVLTRWVWHLVVDSYSGHQISMTWLRTPIYIPQLFIAVGISMLTIEVGVSLIKQLAGMTKVGKSRS